MMKATFEVVIKALKGPGLYKDHVCGVTAAAVPAALQNDFRRYLCNMMQGCREAFDTTWNPRLVLLA